METERISRYREEKDIKLKPRHFVPIVGVYRYCTENNWPEDTNPEINKRNWFLCGYNVLVPLSLILIKKGLESLI